MYTLSIGHGLSIYTLSIQHGPSMYTLSTIEYTCLQYFSIDQIYRDGP